MLCMKLGLNQLDAAAIATDGGVARLARSNGSEEMLDVKFVHFQDVLDKLIEHSYTRTGTFKPPPEHMIKKLGAARPKEPTLKACMSRSAKNLLHGARLSGEQLRDFNSDAGRQYAIMLCAAIYREQRGVNRSVRSMASPSLRTPSLRRGSQP